MAEEQIAWMALSSGTPIVTADGTELGRVHEVIADRQKDIFSGVTFRDGVLGKDQFVPAALVDRLTSEQVLLTASAAEAKEKIEPYEA